MGADTAQPFVKRRLFPTALHVLLTIYGILYLVFVIIGFIPSQEGSPVSDSVPYHPFALEGSLVKILFVFFLVGFFMAWKNRLAAGVLFILWWAAMWGLETLMVARGGSGGAIVMGFPLFVLGVMFVISGYRQRRLRSVPSQP
jgi:hypothetical protein